MAHAIRYGNAAPSAAPIIEASSPTSRICTRINGEHLATGRADRLQRADHVALAIEVALDRVGDADTAHQERGEADQRQVLREAIDAAFELRRGLGARADLPAGVRQPRLCLTTTASTALSLAAVWQAQPVMPAHQAAGLQQAGRA